MAVFVREPSFRVPLGEQRCGLWLVLFTSTIFHEFTRRALIAIFRAHHHANRARWIIAVAMFAQNPSSFKPQSGRRSLGSREEPLQPAKTLRTASQRFEAPGGRARAFIPIRLRIVLVAVSLVSVLWAVVSISLTEGSLTCTHKSTVNCTSAVYNSTSQRNTESTIRLRVGSSMQTIEGCALVSSWAELIDFCRKQTLAAPLPVNASTWVSRDRPPMWLRMRERVWSIKQKWTSPNCSIEVGV